jgi:CHAD domain-containing protein
MKARRVKHLDPDGPLADNAARIVAMRLAEVRSFVPKALDPDQVDALHEMRIAAKRLRYVLELTADTCFGAYAQTGARRARELQDLLGEIHDRDVLLARVADRSELGLLADVARARRAELFSRFVELWRSLERAGFPARLEYSLTERPSTGVVSEVAHEHG